jgi:hypothetical protein
VSDKPAVVASCIQVCICGTLRINKGVLNIRGRILYGGK